MLEFLPIEFFPCPEGQPVLVHLVDDRYCYGLYLSDAYDSHFVIQLPFEMSQGVHFGMIKEWALLPESNNIDRKICPTQ